MCGIAGYVGIPSGDAGEAVLRRMARQLEHRGPDGEGMLVHGHTGLVHRRLAVIDRAGGEQPMRSPDGRYVIIYNGEIYNFRELREELTARGHWFTTRSDTEVVLAAWREWGAGAFDRCNGMFALAILDTHTGHLVLARDQFGIKPLYLTADGSGRVAFGSELRAVLAAGVVPRRPDDVTIYRYLRFRVHDDTERTFFDRISRLMPGELARITPDGQVRRETYTRLYHDLDWLAAAPQRYDRDAREQVRTQLHEAVRRRLVSDVPVGTALSGGLDSSTVVTLIHQLLTAQDTEAGAVGGVQKTFSAVFPGERNDEERYVDAVAAGCGGRLDVHKVHPDPDEFVADLEDFVRTQEEPVISTGPYAQYCVMRQAGRHVTVMLDGQGADEMMAGYLPYFLVHLRDLHRRRGLLRAGVEALRSGDVFWRLGRSQLRDQLRRRAAVSPTCLLAGDFAVAHQDEQLSVVDHHLKRRLADDIFRHSLPSLLRYEDRYSMRFGVEGRVPFLDQDLLRLLWSLDSAAIVRGGWNKRALRDATEDVLPQEVHQRRNKIGFTTPEDAWFDRLKGSVYEVFASPSFGSRPYFQQHAVEEAFRSYLAGRASAETMLFWRLLNVELWLQEYIDRDPTRPPAATFVDEDRAVARATERRQLARRGEHPPPAPKPDWRPNDDKHVVAADRRHARFPLQMPLVRSGDDIVRLATERVDEFFGRLPEAPPDIARLATDGRWYLFVSEKAVAVAQGRSFFTWEVHPSWWARRLSRHVVRTPHGIGLGDPTTMQLAIDDVGLPRILCAAAASAAGKVVGRRGVFYRVAGRRVAAIDGPTQYSAYPANVSAKLAPADPTGVARQISAAVAADLPHQASARYGGTVVIDANDLGRAVLGHDTDLPDTVVTAAFADNPLGQGREQTPVAVVFALPATRGAEALSTDGGRLLDGARSPAAPHATGDGQRRSSLRRTSADTSPSSSNRSSQANDA